VALLVHVSVASRAEGDQVLFVIIATTTAELLVMNFKTSQATAVLAAPIVALEHSMP
jgi:hypothetical protein